MTGAARGFTLIETLIATTILVPALTCVAFLFAYSVAADMASQQRAAGTLLVSERLEQLRSAGDDSAAWNPGQYSEFVRVGADGALSVSTSDATAPYVRVWWIEASVPRTVSVIVYAQRSGMKQQPSEIARATMLRP